MIPSNPLGLVCSCGLRTNCCSLHRANRANLPCTYMISEGHAFNCQKHRRIIIKQSQADKHIHNQSWVHNQGTMLCSQGTVSKKQSASHQAAGGELPITPMFNGERSSHLPDHIPYELFSDQLCVPSDWTPSVRFDHLVVSAHSITTNKSHDHVHYVEACCRADNDHGCLHLLNHIPTYFLVT